MKIVHSPAAAAAASAAATESPAPGSSAAQAAVAIAQAAEPALLAPPPAAATATATATASLTFPCRVCKGREAERKCKLEGGEWAPVCGPCGLALDEARPKAAGSILDQAAAALAQVQGEGAEE